ncbi:MAG: efflux RND transporter periplasmic adaptor subunit [Pirellulales bacterium]|nr:efflux RND transporter periplasmic adaptor subunit [Pirellulales bacterium]
MKTATNLVRQSLRWGWQILLAVGFTAGVIVLLLWLAGKFEKKVPAKIEKSRSEAKIEGRVERVRLLSLSMTESAVGSVRAVHETSIGSKLLARVVEVNIKAGQKVKTGDILFRLDDTDLKAKLEQAKATVEAANAAAANAELDAKRVAELLPAKAISRQDYDKVMAQARSAKAEVDRAGEALKEAQAMLDWATVRSSLDGVVIDKKVDVGDMVVPGKILATLYNPDRMQLVASVRDSLAGFLHVDQPIDVQVEGMEHRCGGTVSEIVPESQSASRSFQVKVTGPCPPGIHAGLFGRIFIPLGKEQIFVIPKAAVRNVGQLELVEVVENGKPMKRSIRCGRTGKDEPALGENVEVLSGLREGEEVVVPKNSQSTQEANHG